MLKFMIVSTEQSLEREPSAPQRIPRHIAGMLSGIVRHMAYELGNWELRDHIIGIETAQSPGGDRSLLSAIDTLESRHPGTKQTMLACVSLTLAADFRSAQPVLPPPLISSRPTSGSELVIRQVA
jgi:hypothetical protein